MKSTIVVSVTPNKLNIKYGVQIIKVLWEETFAPLVKEVRLNCVTTNRAIIYCHLYESCSLLYLTRRLGPEKTEPIGAPDINCFRLVDIFTACTTPPVKENILASFCKLNGKLRVVIATVAFGMGLDCPNVCNIYHWGAPGDLEQYLQETGCAGRDSSGSGYVVLQACRPCAQCGATPMKEYCRNKDICSFFSANLMERMIAVLLYVIVRVAIFVLTSVSVICVFLIEMIMKCHIFTSICCLPVYVHIYYAMRR